MNLINYEKHLKHEKKVFVQINAFLADYTHARTHTHAARMHACTNTHTPPPHLLILSTFVVPLPNYPLLPQLFRTKEYSKLFTGILTVVNRTLIIV